MEGDAPRDGQIEGRFARYIMNQHFIMLNADFATVQDDILRFVSSVTVNMGNLNGSTILRQVTLAVRKWNEVLASESVMGVRRLRGLFGWTESTIEVALSEEALTTAAMHRHYLNNAVKRELGSLGFKFKD